MSSEELPYVYDVKSQQFGVAGSANNLMIFLFDYLSLEVRTACVIHLCSAWTNNNYALFCISLID